MDRPEAIGAPDAARRGPRAAATTSTHSRGDRDQVEAWAEEFLERRRRGERPTVEEYVAAHPEHAEAIRELFDAVVLIEDLKPRSDDESARLGGFTLQRGDRPIERLGDYRLLREVGRGGMGVVYEAEQESLGRRVALKVLAPWSSPSPQQVQRFHREARAAAQLHHTNIVPVFGVGEAEGLHYYAMQYIQGLGLDAVLEEVRRLQGKPPVDDSVAEEDGPAATGLKAASATEVARTLIRGGLDEPPERVSSAAGEEPGALARPIRPLLAVGMPGSTELTSVSDSARPYARSVARVGLQVAEALAYAHEQGTLHRDVKPSNLLLDGHGIVWVSDFGLAKAADDVDLTRTGDLVGTLRYMPPERFRGECDPRSDLYALGLTLYELLAYRPAFEESNRHGLIHSINHDEPPRLRKVNPAVPRDLETILQKAIEKAPVNRYASARHLADDLRRFLDGRPIQARRIGLAERSLRWARRRPSQAALVSAVLLLLVAVATISTVAAIRLGRKHLIAMEYLHRAELARVEARHQLWDSYLAQARASRRSGRAGRRFEALEVLRAAAAMGLNPDRIGELRREAIAGLALADLREVAAFDDPAIRADRAPAAFSPHLRRIAVGDRDGTIRILEVSSGREAARLPGFGDRVASLRYAPDGTALAVHYDEGGRVHLGLWDLTRPDREPIAMVPRGVHGRAYDFRPDGALLAAAEADGTIRLYDVRTGEPVRSWPSRPAPDAIRFDPRGERLAASRILPQAAITVHDAATGDVLARLPTTHADRGLAWSPDGRHLAVGCDDTRLRVYDPSRPGAEPRLLEGHQGQVISVEYHPSGDLLASAGWDGAVRLWDPRSGAELLSTPSPDAWDVRFSHDGRHLALGRDGSRVFAWEVATARESRIVAGTQGEGQGTWSVAYHPDGTLFASAGGNVVRLDVPGLGAVASIPMPFAQGAEFLPDGSGLITSGDPGLLLWPIRREVGSPVVQVGPPEPIGPDPGHPTRRFCLSPDGRSLAVVYPSLAGEIVAFPIAAPGRAITMRGHPGLERIAMSPDARWVATGTWKGSEVRIWDLRDGSLAAALPVTGSADVAFSPDGSRLVTGSGEEFRAWEVGTWRPLPMRYARHDSGEQPGKLDFAPGGSMLAVTRSRDLVALIDPATGEDLAVLESPSPWHVASLGFDPTGSVLAVTYNLAGIRFWDLRSTRASLRSMGLDWDPPGPPDPSPGSVAPVPVRVEVQLPLWMIRTREAEESIVAGDLEAASRAYEQALEAGARDFETRYRAAIVRLATGDPEGYRRSCGALFKDFGAIDDPLVVAWLAWTCVLGPGASSEPDALVALAERLVEIDGRAYAWNTLGAALVRAGRPSEAIPALERAIELDGDGGSALDALFLALAHDALGHGERARRQLQQAEDLLRKELDSLRDESPTRATLVRLEYDIVRREVEGRLADMPGSVDAIPERPDPPPSR